MLLSLHNDSLKLIYPFIFGENVSVNMLLYDPLHVFEDMFVTQQSGQSWI